MQEYIVTYYPAAIDDITDIYSYLLDNNVSEDVARKQINTILEVLESLTVFPERYASVDSDKWKNKGMHKVPIKNYIAFYIVDNLNLRVNIVRIFHQGRNLEYIIKDDRLLVCEK